MDSTVGASLTQTRTTANDATWNKLSQEHKVDYYTSAVGKVIGAATVGAVTPIKKTEIGESSYLKPNTEGSGVGYYGVLVYSLLNNVIVLSKEKDSSETFT